MGWEDIRSGNPVKETLAAGGVAVGVFVRMGSTEAVEVCAHAGCDFVIIDTEHGPLDWSGAAALIIAAEAAGTVPILRLYEWSRALVTRALDIGAHGVMIPQVTGPDDAAGIVAATRYGPDGTRGTAGNRRSGFGMRLSTAEFTEAANAATLVAVQIETVAAVEQVEAIAAVPGIDCLFVGLADLSVDLGIPGQWDSPLLAEHVARIRAAADANGVAFGVPAVSAAAAVEHVGAGARFVASGDTGLLGGAVRAFVREVRASGA